MKKLIITAAFTLLSVCAFSQITVRKTSETIAKAMGGKEKLNRYISENNDTTFYLVLYTYNQFAGSMTVTLGDTNETIALLESMLEYKPTSKDEVIELNNPDNNRAYYQSDLGYEQFKIYGDDSAESRIGGYIGKKSIKKFLSAIYNPNSK